MLAILHCRWCNGDKIGKDEVSCTVTCHKTNFCDKHHDHGQNYELFFCSASCMVKYMAVNNSVFLQNVDLMKENEYFPIAYRVTPEHGCAAHNIEIKGETATGDDFFPNGLLGRYDYSESDDE